MIARSRVLLLEGSLVFLVHYHHAEARKRQEDGAACAQNYVVRIVRQLLLPYFHTFSVAVTRVIDAQSRSEHTLQSLRHLHRQGNFGQQIEHLLAFVQHSLDEMDVYLRLSA